MKRLPSYMPRCGHLPFILHGVLTRSSDLTYFLLSIAFFSGIRLTVIPLSYTSWENSLFTS